MIHDLHTRISTAIDLGYVVDAYGNHVKLYTKQGLNVLGNIVQGNADSVNVQLYGQLDLLMRKVLGFGYESNVKYQVVPSALQMWSTSLRDPVFFSMYKTIVDYYHKYVLFLYMILMLIQLSNSLIFTALKKKKLIESVRILDTRRTFRSTPRKN